MSADYPPIAADKTGELADGESLSRAHPQKSRRRMDKVTWKIIGAAYRAHRHFGNGFLEKVYENALKLELSRDGLCVEQQHPICVRYGEEIVGEYVADMFVDRSVIVEVKAIEQLARIHHAQCLHYLRATGLHVGLLLNFGAPRLELKRIVHDF